MKQITSFRKLSLFHNSPDWRYRIYMSLDPILMQYHRKHQEKHNERYNPIGDYLLRFVYDCDVDVTINPMCILSKSLTDTIDELSPELRDKFRRIQTKHLRKVNQKKYVIDAPMNNIPQCTEWRLKDIESIDDEWLKKLILRMSGVESNSGIDLAMKLKASPRHDEVFRYIGYSIFLGKTDSEVAAMWEIDKSAVEAMRMLFFDFSQLPKDTIAKMAFFRQLVVNGVYTEADFNFFKLLDELGDTGLKAITSFKLLDKDDSVKIEHFYGTSMLENVLRLKLAIRTGADSLNYNNVINMLGTFFMKKADLKLSAAKTHNLEAVTLKIQTDMGNNIKTGQEHEKLFDAVRHMQSEVKTISLEVKPQPTYKPITALK